MELADQELDCEWKIFVIGDEPSLATWLSVKRRIFNGFNLILGLILIHWLIFNFQKQLEPDRYVGADAKTIPHQLWVDWDRELSQKYLKMSKVKNLIDIIGGENLVSPRDFSIKTHNSTFAGVHWHTKVEQLREQLRIYRCDAMVVTSLTEIAYLLNLRGSDFRYIPVFNAYLIVSQGEIILYTNRSKVSTEAQLMMNFEIRMNSCFKERCVM